MTQQASIGSVNQDGLSGWWRAYLRHRYAVLFYSLLLTLVGGPILKALGFTGNFLQFFLGLNLLAAAPQVASRKGRWVLPAIVLAAVMLRIGSLQVDLPGLSTANLVLWTLIALYAVLGALRFALRAATITPPSVFATERHLLQLHHARHCWLR